ncbi:MAG: hypothetical protein A3K59_05670 [Euryarchaeota archaeon RBG_19FT_COMBO_69_17]|nr:MAG: hypothetical protein A3K59_05670 [Euryarchaeota archaeon RBG_19FT_COMBO_69_17]
MHGTRTRTTIIALLVVASAAGAWLAGPLFLVTRANAPVPAGFETVVKEGTWAGRDDFHFASGSARILTDGRGAYVLRLEAFRVQNGPDIELFLSSDAAYDASDVVLGDVPATDGSYNVPIPAGTDVSAVTHALVYCVPFHVLFATAALA